MARSRNQPVALFVFFILYVGPIFGEISFCLLRQCNNSCLRSFWKRCLFSKSNYIVDYAVASVCVYVLIRHNSHGRIFKVQTF